MPVMVPTGPAEELREWHPLQLEQPPTIDPLGRLREPQESGWSWSQMSTP